MKILFCTTEVQPFSKDGGLADFSASLPKALNSLGNKVNIVSPYYKVIKEDYGHKAVYLGERKINFGDFEELANYYLIVENEQEFYFVSHPYFERDNYYDYRDDAKRFVFYNIAILEMISLINFYPNIIHVNNWHTALIPYFIDSIYLNHPHYKDIKTLLTIHTLEKQGSFPMAVETFITKKNYTYQHNDQVNYLKAGIMRASRINTVSKSYRSEILTKFFGFSLDGPLKARQYELLGIQNGIDFSIFNPSTDANIFKNYNVDNFIEGKQINKTHLLNELNFKDKNKPIVTLMGRLASDKGIDLIIEFIDHYLKNDLFYLIVAGGGDYEYEDFFEALKEKYPNNFHFYKGHTHKINQNIFSASDIFIMPSLYEASGLNQMAAMRYGVIPIVRSTGGLKDTVSQYDFNTKTGNGFLFKNYDSDELMEVLDKVLDIYKNDKETWNTIVINGMNLDNSIDKMAKAYHELYEEMMEI